MFTHFCVEVKIQFNASIRIPRSDNAKEYMLEIFLSYMRQLQQPEIRRHTVLRTISSPEANPWHLLNIES